MNEAVTQPDQPTERSDGDEGQLAWFKQQLGSQANEIGQLRNALELKIDEQDAAILSESFDSDQIKAVERMVEKKLAPMQQAVNTSAADALEQKLLARHADYQEVIQTPQFQSWVNESRINTAAYETAIAGDIDTGIDLLDQYKASNPSQPQQAAMATALTSSRGSSGDSGIREGGVLSREEIRQMKMTNKPKYRAMLPEIMKAYAEGRVR